MPSAVNGGPHVLVSSPTPGRSILTTSAPVVCEHHRRVRTGEHAGEVGDHKAVESSWCPIILGRRTFSIWQHDPPWEPGTYATVFSESSCNGSRTGQSRDRRYASVPPSTVTTLNPT